MNNTMILVKANIKKTKAQTAAIFILVTITALIINLCLMVGLDYEDGFDLVCKELNEADVTLMMAGPSVDVEKIESDYLAGNADVTAYQVSPVAMLEGEIPCGEDTSYKTFFFAISRSEADSRAVGKYRYEQSVNGSGVFLPYQFHVSGNFAVGDRFVLNSNGSPVVDCIVRGFYVSAMTSSINARICGIILTDDLYETVNPVRETPFGKMASVMVSVNLSDGADCARFEYNAASDIAKDYKNLYLLTSNNAELVKDTDYSTQIVVVAVMAVSGLIFSIVTIVLISSNIAFFINTNIKNFGMLKAIGYKSSKLRRILLAEFAIIGLFAVFLGTALSYALFPTLNTLMESITTIPYPVHFMGKQAAITVAVIMAFVLITAWSATYNLKHLPPIAAIRSVNAKSRQKRAIFPVEKSKLPVTLNLALKTTCLNWKQNIIVLITLLGISFGSVFCILMYQNVLQKKEPVLEMISQLAHSFVNIDSSQEESFRTQMENDDRVETYYMYSRRGSVLAGDTVLLPIVVDDCSKIHNRVLVHSGVMPTKDNEVAIGVLYAENNHVHLGDTLSISFGDNREDYKVTAFIQMIGSGGKDIIFLPGGYKKLAKLEKLDNTDFYIVLKDYGDIQRFNSDMSKLFPTAQVEDFQKRLDNKAADFIRLMRYIVISIIVLCISLMAFVLYLLVKTLLFKKQREYSIMKSIGYHTNTLIVQTALSFLPVVVLSLVVSLPLASLTINDIFSIFLHGLGVFRTVFEFSDLWVALAGISIVALAFSFVCLFSLKIRRYSPKKLLSENV